VTGIEPALSAWESVRLRPSTWPDLRVGVSASDRERPLVAGANCTTITGYGVPPRWRREDPAACRVGSEGLKQRGDSPYAAGSGAAAPSGPDSSRRSSPWCSSSLCIGANAPPVLGVQAPPQPNTDSGRSWTSRSILEPEVPPEANDESDTCQLGNWTLLHIADGQSCVAR
jgi:hypothetical protein